MGGWHGLPGAVGGVFYVNGDRRRESAYREHEALIASVVRHPPANCAIAGVYLDSCNSGAKHSTAARLFHHPDPENDVAGSDRLCHVLDEGPDAVCICADGEGENRRNWWRVNMSPRFP